MNDPRFAALLEFLKKNNANYVIVDAKIEEDLKDMTSEEKGMFREELGFKRRRHQFPY
jgi:ribosome-binding ATPase YchF (GTP1/OBG family)